MSNSTNNSSSFAIEKAQAVVLNFRQKFGEGHYWLACHAAFPLALTPELLYTLRANFLFDNHGGQLRSPWIAVADILLNLCKETGHELYQMDPAIRDLLLRELRNNKRFHKGHFPSNRLQQLGHFLLAYVEQHLYSSDENLQTFAEAQSWAALTYIHPQEATQKIAQAIAKAQTVEDDHEQVRLQILLDNLLEEHPELDRLRQYAQANVANMGGNSIPSENFMAQVKSSDKIEIAGVTLNNLVVEERLSPTELQIRILQNGLKDLGYYSGDLTAKMDDLTTAAVEEFLADQQVDGNGKSLTFLLREIEGALDQKRGKKVKDIKLKVYLSNSNQLRFSENFQFLYRPLLDKLKALESKGLIELDYYTKHTGDDFTNKDAIDHSRESAELTLMPINPKLIKAGMVNRKNIADFYTQKMTSKSTLVVPILLENLGEYQDDFAHFPQLPADGIPLVDGQSITGQSDTVHLETMLNDIEALVDRLTHLKRSHPEEKLVFEKSDYDFLYDASVEKVAEENVEIEQLEIYLSYTNPDREQVEQVLNIFREMGNYNFIDPEVELEGIDFRDVAEERKNLWEKADLVLAFLSPDYLVSSPHIESEFRPILSQEYGEQKIKLVPILLRPCLIEWSKTQDIGRIPVSGIPFSSLNNPKILAEDFLNITQKTIEDKATKAKGQERKGLWGSQDFFNPESIVFPIDELGKTPKNLLIRYTPEDRAYFDRLVTHLESLSDYKVFNIDQQEFGISKIDPTTEQYYAIDRADVIINLISRAFLQHKPFMDSVLQILGNVQSGDKKAFNIILSGDFEKNVPLWELPLLEAAPIQLVNNDTRWTAVCRALIEALKEESEEVAEDTQMDFRSLSIERLIELCHDQEWESLDLSGRQLKEIPEGLARLPLLSELDLSSNKLSELASFIFRSLPNIRTINLADNILEEIPEAISQWQMLEEINLSNNRLQRLPIELNLIEPLPTIRVFNNPLPIYSKVIHDNPANLFDIILTNQHWVKNKSVEEKIEVQTALAKFQKVTINGELDQSFFEALYRWQEDNNLKPGALDKDTLDALLTIDLKLKEEGLEPPIQQQSAEAPVVEELEPSGKVNEIIELISDNKIDSVIRLLLDQHNPVISKQAIIFASQYSILGENIKIGILDQSEFLALRDEQTSQLLTQVFQFDKENLIVDYPYEPHQANLPPLAKDKLNKIKDLIRAGKIKEALSQTQQLSTKLESQEDIQTKLILLSARNNKLRIDYYRQEIIALNDYLDRMGNLVQEFLELLHDISTFIESGNFSNADFEIKTPPEQKTSKRKGNLRENPKPPYVKNIENIRNLLAKAEYDEAMKLALQNQESFPTLNDHRVGLLTLSARIKRIKESEAQGLLTHQGIQVERNKFAFALLNLLNEIEKYHLSQ